MLTLEENELLTRTGPGTPMGELMRRYWLPAVLSWELPEPDCPPVRVKLLGEAMVMFRDTQNRIGLLDEFCAHRGTSLWLGRNEQSGLRCVWHGWKYDVNGQCVDQLNERGGTSFAQKIRIKSYPTLELGGVIWAYMGPPEKRPPRAAVWLDSGSRDSPACVEGHTRMQLAPGRSKAVWTNPTSGYSTVPSV